MQSGKVWALANVSYALTASIWSHLVCTEHKMAVQHAEAIPEFSLALEALPSEEEEHDILVERSSSLSE